MSARRAVVASLAALAFCLFVPTGGVSAAEAGAAPIPGGMARVWFLRQYEPSVSLATPMIFVDSAPLAASQPGTAFFRDFRPGTHSFSVASYGVDFGQTETLQLVPGMQVYLEIQALPSWASGHNYTRDTFYVRMIPPELAARYLPQMTDLGGQ